MVRDARLRVDAVMTVARAAVCLGLVVAGVVASPLPGPSGNIEYFLWLHRGVATDAEDVLRSSIEAVVRSTEGGSS